jgi:HD-like signal output (HDOD) protein
MNADELGRAVQRMDSIPSPSWSLERILELASDTESDIQRLAESVEADPAVTARVLRFANSAYYGVARDVDTVRRAIIVVGYKNVLSLAACAALAPVFGSRDHVVDRGALWLHSCGTAEASRIVADQVGFDPATAHVAGLLHDLGIVALSEILAEEYGAVVEEARRRGEPLIEVERRLLGADHAALAGFLFERWKLPARLLAGVVNHHEPLADSSGLAAVVALGDELAARAGFTGVTGYQPEDDPRLELLTALELTQADSEKILAELAERRAAVETLAGVGARQ